MTIRNGGRNNNAAVK